MDRKKREPIYQKTPRLVNRDPYVERPVSSAATSHDSRISWGAFTLNHAAYSAGRNNSVSTVATSSPPMIATAIGPQKLLRVRGIIARIAAAAVSMIGRNRRTVDSIMAVQSG